MIHGCVSSVALIWIEVPPSAKRRHRNDVDSTPMSIVCPFTSRVRLESGPEIDMLATFDVESIAFRCRRIFLSPWA